MVKRYEIKQQVRLSHHVECLRWVKAGMQVASCFFQPIFSSLFLPAYLKAYLKA